MDAAPNEPTTTDAATPEQARETTINRNWLIKIVIFLVVLFAFGLWGLYDATIAYPNRGREHAEWAERNYLTIADETGRLLAASVENPEEALADLRSREEDLRDQVAQAGAESLTRSEAEAALELAKYEWLRALSLVGDLDPARTTFDQPRERLRALQQEWEERNPPKPLAFYDIPAQWIITAVGFGGAAYLSLLLFRVGRKKFHYDPDTSTLTLPDGRTVSPDEIEEVDKRKWDKFFVTLRLKGDKPPVKLDLLRYKHLEDWVLEMEKQTEGYEPPAEEIAAQEAATPPTEPKQAGDLPPEPDDQPDEASIRREG